MMKTLLLLTVLLFVGIVYVRADEGVDTGGRTKTIPLIVEEDVHEIFHDDEMEVRGLKVHHKHKNKTVETVHATKQKDLEKKLKKEHKEKHHTKFYIKVIGGIIAVCVVGGIIFCYKSMCKKKQRSVDVDREEAMEAFHPNANFPQLDLYPPPPPQKMPYPLQQMPYTAEQPSFSGQPLHHPLQQTPYPTEQSSFLTQPMSYPSQQRFFPMEQASFSAQPTPYPSQQFPYSHQTNVHSPQCGFTYPKDPTTYPPPP